MSITRPGKWGNPFVWDGVQTIYAVEPGRPKVPVLKFEITMSGNPDRALAVCLKLYELHIVHCVIFEGMTGDTRIPFYEIRKELKGKNLMCFCKEGKPCHGDLLLKIANSTKDDQVN